VFGHGYAVADVKYKVSGGEWPRSDLYQAIAFAEAFGTTEAAIVRFRPPSIAPRDDLSVGAKTVREISWISDEALAPAYCAEAFADEVAAWLSPPIALTA
jgi:hypothetical protein